MLTNDHIFTIDASTPHSELTNVHKSIVENIDKIETIDVKQGDEIGSSALLSLLISIKSSNPKIKIPLIDDEKSSLNGLGSFSIVK